MKNKQKFRPRIDIRCSAKEKQQAQEWAKDAGMTLSEYCRQKVFGRKVIVRFVDQGKGEREQI